ncbi:LysR family transcriptional regulator [Curvibacter sp. HBC28]|jgi:DNA-binding transcriptional LysR family regulator|uniref:LysR family transcriptional regulator n=1 Tax=Curvibacter microcysteis TaxID=3026419 RepID=A0ABT5MHK2_9BURK|nr:LysR family transcriptional regulator [Curvibacter sp. HBC28]MDD0815464.1 LysR family transcriptional regulator [Curvibacter sp. HBC28]
MELRQLKHLICLAECGSFSRAAEQLHLTQSALSRSIQALEASLGVPLVDRLGKRNELTPLGRWVTERARRVLFEANDLQEGLQHLSQADLGTLRVGLGSGPGALLMTPLLQHMARHHPGVKVSVSRGSTELQLQLLRERQLDALVVDLRRVAPAEDLRIQVLAELQAAFIARSGHPLLASAQVQPFAALLAYPLATTPLSDEVARLLVDLYGESANPEQMASLRCEDVGALLDTVAQTDAVFLGIRAAARQGMVAGTLAEVPVSPALQASARFGLVTLRGRTESPLMGLLRDFVRRHLHD